jgi:DnaK suppressor protein
VVSSSIAGIDHVGLDRLRLLLLQERASLAGHAGPVAGASDGDAARPELDELDGIRYEQGMSQAVASLNRSALAEVDAALARIADGTYGSCLGCGTGIPVERLEVMPAAAYCVSCQQLRE